MLRSKVVILLISVLPFYSICFGQDSIFQVDSSEIRTKKNRKFIFAFDARRSFVNGTKVKFNGIKFGFEYHEVNRFGIGFYPLQEPVHFTGEIDKSTFPDATDTLFMHYSYLSLFYERIWFRNKRWQLTTPVHFGVGGLELRYQNIEGKRSPVFFQKDAFMTAMGGSVQFKAFRWFALGTGFGYRFSLSTKQNLRKPLNAPYYQIQFKVLLGELYRMTFRRKHLEPWE